MFYKIAENGYITMIGKSQKVPSNGEEITEARHIELSNTIKARPQDTLESVYRLSNETEEYIAIPRTHSETVDWYIQAVSSGTMNLDEVPEEYRSEVEARADDEATEADYISALSELGVNTNEEV